MRPHHIGYLVKDIETAIQELLSLGYRVEKETFYDPYRDINVCFMVFDRYRVELVMPISEKSVVHNLLKRRGGGVYHICYETENLVDEGEKLRERGYIPLDEITLAPAIDGAYAGFFFSSKYGIVELIGRERTL